MANFVDCELTVRAGEHHILKEFLDYMKADYERRTSHELKDEEMFKDGDINPSYQMKPSQEILSCEACSPIPTEKRGGRVLTKDDVVASIKDTIMTGDSLTSTINRHGTGGSPKWRIDNWGTPSDLKNVQQPHATVEDDYDERFTNAGFTIPIAFFTFESNTSPPVKAIKAMSKRFPNILFTLDYYEANWMFRGRAVFFAGDVMDHTEGTYAGRRGG